MAGIAGIYCADGRPAEVADLKRMTAAVESRGADGVTYWNAGPVAFAHVQLCTTPESLHERQPLVSPGGEACLVWNGRLDNREDLLAALAAEGARPVDSTDPGFVLAAYLLWGADCVQHIVGDFAFAVWDASDRRLWCARDYVGIRPFYYFWDGKTFLFGPEVRALLAHPLVSLKINEGMAGEYLANAITSRDETLYADLRRLPSGSTLTIDASGRLQIASWWKPELSLIEYRSDEEYADHFRHLFDQSIRAQTRCNTPWGIELSGGLDSSSIAVSARAVLNESGSEDARILTFSATSPGKPWDESEDIAAVVEKARLTPEFVQPMQVDLNFFRQRAEYWRDFPGNPNGEPMHVPIYNAAKGKGVRVLLTGIGGDELLAGRLEHVLDIASCLFSPRGCAGAVRELFDRSRFDWGEYGCAHHWSTFLARRLVVTAAPDWLFLKRKQMRLARHSILSAQFLRRTNLAERIFAAPKHERRFASRAQQAVFHLITSAAQAQVFDWNGREPAGAGLELRLPYFDRRLVEFCLRLPEDQRQRGPVWKRMLRNSMRGRLPQRVHAKTYKAEFSELFTGIFSTAESRSRLQNLKIPRNTDWFDAANLKKRLTATLGSDDPSLLASWSIWRMIGIDLWVEHVISSGKMQPESHQRGVVAAPHSAGQ